MSNIKIPNIGDVVLSPHEKFSDSAGINKFDQLLCDGSEVFESKYPLYYAYLREISPVFGTTNSYFEGSSSPWMYDDLYYTWSEGQISTNTTDAYKRITQILDVPMVQGEVYRVTVVCTQYTSGSLYVRQPRDGIVSDLHRAITGVGTFTWDIVATNEGSANDLLNVALSTNDGTAGGGSGADLTISSFTVEEATPVWARRPIMASGSDACPYKVVADKYTPSIGEVHPSNQEKYYENGVAMFDNLLCDQSEVFESEHPEYYATFPEEWSLANSNDTAPVLYLRDISYYNNEVWCLDKNSSVLRVFSKDMSTHRNVSIVLKGTSRQGLCVTSGGIYIGSFDGRIDKYGLTGGVAKYGRSTTPMEVTSAIGWDGEFLYATGEEDNGTLYQYVDTGSSLSDTGVTRQCNIGAGVRGISKHPLGWLVSGSPGVFIVSEDFETIIDTVVTGDQGAGHGVDTDEDDVIYVANNGVLKYRAGKFLPANTSTYPNFPDRVIADLTEDE